MYIVKYHLQCDDDNTYGLHNFTVSCIFSINLLIRKRWCHLVFYLNNAAEIEVSSDLWSKKVIKWTERKKTLSTNLYKLFRNGLAVEMMPLPLPWLLWKKQQSSYWNDSHRESFPERPEWKLLRMPELSLMTDEQMRESYEDFLVVDMVKDGLQVEFPPSDGLYLSLVHSSLHVQILSVTKLNNYMNQRTLCSTSWDLMKELHI